MPLGRESVTRLRLLCPVQAKLSAKNWQMQCQMRITIFPTRDSQAKSQHSPTFRCQPSASLAQLEQPKTNPAFDSLTT
jgi:hypothetical protein